LFNREGKFNAHKSGAVRKRGNPAQKTKKSVLRVEVDRGACGLVPSLWQLDVESLLFLSVLGKQQEPEDTTPNQRAFLFRDRPLLKSYFIEANAANIFELGTPNIIWRFPLFPELTFFWLFFLFQVVISDECDSAIFGSSALRRRSRPLFIFCLLNTWGEKLLAASRHIHHHCCCSLYRHRHHRHLRSCCFHSRQRHHEGEA
jgi:hypothetical protein